MGLKSIRWSQRVVGVILGRAKGQKEQLGNRVRFISKLIRVVLRCASWRVHVSVPPVSATWVLKLYFYGAQNFPPVDFPSDPRKSAEKRGGKNLLLLLSRKKFLDLKFWRKKFRCVTKKKKKNESHDWILIENLKRLLSLIRSIERHLLFLCFVTLQLFKFQFTRSWSIYESLKRSIFDEQANNIYWKFL